MPTRFVARVVGFDDEFCMIAAVGERDDDTGRSLIFQAGHEPPDTQDIRLGMDSYCLVTENHGTAYGCVRKLSVVGDRMHVTLAEESLVDLGLDETEIEVQLAVDPQSVNVLRTYLERILSYGRRELLPTELRLQP